MDKLHRILNHAGQVVAVASEMIKAFDRVPHHILIKKPRPMEVSEYLVNFVSGYLPIRKQHVIIDGAPSEKTKVSPGVP